MYDLQQFLMIGLALFGGCLLQSMVGFGLGMFAIPIMNFAGVNLPSCIALVLGIQIFQTGYSVYRHPGAASWRETLPLFYVRMVSLPLGVLLLWLMEAFDPQQIKQVVGGVLLVAVGMQWLIRPKPHEYLHWGWTVAAGSTSGIMAGMVGMGGPPVVLFVHAHDWSALKSRAFMWITFFQNIPVLILLLCVSFGVGVLWDFILGIVMFPIAFAAALVGHKIGRRLNRRRLKVVAYLLLTLIAVSAIVGPLIVGG
ncbi:sulfite exporter TauE/SafE family protein [Poriferisphaera sp. WC338]|uniref:sulfite exporter TauE/SafE family protein n=1 Tax=Poriferisphaera sp. WC338 TaxID=3425129 RepID=UPI003D8133CA